MTYVFLFLLLLVVVVAYIKLVPMLKVGTGYAAKTTCSAVFVSGRSLESVQQAEMTNSSASIVKVNINEEEKSATGQFLWIKRKAIYREGLGCTLISKADEAELRKTTRRKKNSSRMAVASLSKIEEDIHVSNINKQQLDKAFAYAFDEPDMGNPRNTRAALVLFNGLIIKEQYKKGFDENTPLLGWSMTKSVTNALAGILVKQGKLSLHEPINLPEWHKNSADKRAKITLHHLLQMNSGLHFEEEYDKISTVNNMLWLKPNAAEIAINQNLKYEPGTFWYYSSGTTNIITQFIKNQFDNEQDYLNFPYTALFEPLGMTSVQLETDASNNYVGSSFMYATLRDWAKFGQLYLNDGIVDRKRLLPNDWVKYSAERNPVSDHGVYAAHFWKNATEPTPDMESNRYWPSLPDDLFYASGFEGQHMMIIPSKKIVIVRLGQTQDRYNWDIGYFTEEVLKALK